MIYAFNDFKLDTDLLELCYQGKNVSIEPQTYNVLIYLISHRERIISKDELLDKLWQGKVVTESSLNTCIKAARKALNDNGKDQHSISTLPRRGYRFVAATEEIISIKAGSNESNSLATKADNPEPLDDRLSLVVIPFRHTPGDEDTTWWADIFSEDISIHLARIPGFKVISRHSVLELSNIENNGKNIGQTLGTRYVIEGSIRKKQQEYRISVQLTDVLSGQLLWANHKSLSTDAIDAFQEDVVQKIVAQIEPELNRAELKLLQHRKPLDMGAWSRCREATALLSKEGWSEQSFTRAAKLLRDAIQRDPKLAFAHAYLSLIIALGHLIGLVKQSDWEQESKQAAETALALDSQDSDVLGHVGCAFADMGDFQRGIPLLKRAIDINPGNAQAWAALGSAKMRSGDESGAEDMSHGIHISPRDHRLAAWGALQSRGLLSYGRVDESIDAARYATRFDDKIFLPRVVLAIAHSTQGNYKSAQLAWQDAKRIRPELCIDDIRWMASTDELDQLQIAGVT